MSPYTSIPLSSISPPRARSLSRFFALRYARERGRPPLYLTRDAEDLIARHDWRNDLLALSSTIRHAVIMAEGPEIGVEVIRLPEARSSRVEASDWDQVEDVSRALMGHTLADMERELVLLTLECCLGNRSFAADVLGISIRTLRNKLKVFARDGMPVTPAAAPSKQHRRDAEHECRSARSAT